MTAKNVQQAYRLAAERYAELGVDVDGALAALGKVSLSLHCWQGDDVRGFERAGELSGGIQVTGNHPGAARTPDELRADLEQAYALLPGRHRLNLHAIYGEFQDKPADRDAIGPEHFRGWVEWARRRKLALDFNATCFSHPKAADGFTLSHPDKAVRRFWVEHVRRCRRIAAGFGRALGRASVHNLWIPDGSKDVPADRWGYRARLKESLDAIFADKLPGTQMVDAVECKLFGIGSESFVVGSHEFYMAYAIPRRLMLCLDMGHFHPTESIADKLSALLPFADGLLLHVSRGVRWDSDHVVVLDDSLQALAGEAVAGGELSKIRFALDYFDGSINRVGAWVLGARATQKALLMALLAPAKLMRKAEVSGDNFSRLALAEEAKSLPHGAVWDYFCKKAGVPLDAAARAEIASYGKRVAGERG
ncbi:MAG TPA: L-rhamnose isomerase [Planctomycetota bacterium]|nr:L-rhamnose isomerase [Planctomycetota bacterium]